MVPPVSLSVVFHRYPYLVPAFIVYLAVVRIHEWLVPVKDVFDDIGRGMPR